MVNVDLKKIRDLLMGIKPYSVLLFVSGSIGIIFLFYSSMVYWRVNWYSTPDFSFSYLLRSSIIALSVTLIAVSFATSHLRNRFELKRQQRIAVTSMVSLTVLCYLLCALFPEAARILGEEDNFIEWISFVILLLAFAMILTIFLKKLLSIKVSPLIYISLLLFAFLLFFMAMEEISWGQRIFGIHTPDNFKENSQNEINLHNFITTEADTIYYLGLCILFIILPYLKMCFPILESNEIFRFLVPGPYIIILGALPLAFHYNKWNLLFTQIEFFGALAIILIIAFHLRRHMLGRLFFIISFIICLIQITFLAGNGTSPVLVSGRIAEHKELISQALLFVYSRDVYLQVSKNEAPERIIEIG